MIYFFFTLISNTIIIYDQSTTLIFLASGGT